MAWDPFRDFKRVQDNINKSFEKVLKDYKKPYSHMTQGPKEVSIEIKLPGIQKKDIILEVEEGRLEVRASKRSRVIKKTRKGSSEMDQYTGFQRVLSLPPNLTIEKTDARFKKETLIVRIPKRKIIKKISIK